MSRVIFTVSNQTARREKERETVECMKVRLSRLIAEPFGVLVDELEHEKDEGEDAWIFAGSRRLACSLEHPSGAQSKVCS